MNRYEVVFENSGQADVRRSYVIGFVSSFVASVIVAAFHGERRSRTGKFYYVQCLASRRRRHIRLVF
jgi:hypothetical protein